MALCASVAICAALALGSVPSATAAEGDATVVVSGGTIQGSL